MSTVTTLRSLRRGLGVGFALALLPTACLTLDGFFFGNQPAESYGWDDDPCDPQLAGELAEAEQVLNGGPEPGCHPSRIPAEDRTEDFVELEDGTRIHYVYARREGAEVTIFYSHGTGRNIGRYWDRVELMWSWGFNVMIYDYPGYGRSEGEPDETGVYASARAVLEVLPEMPGVDPEQVYFMGYSLGGAPSYELASQASQGELAIQPRGVVSEATFCSIDALVEDGSRLDLPGHFFSTYRFDNCSKIGQLDPELPVMILHGSRDAFVVPTHAKQLRDAAVGPLEFHWVEGSDHSQVPVAGGDEYRLWLVEFFNRHRG